MNRKAMWIAATLVLLAAAYLLWWRTESEDQRRISGQRSSPRPPEQSATALRTKKQQIPSGEEAEAAERSFVTAEKLAKIEKIKRDYEELALKLGAEFGAAGKDFPGGLNAYLRQLALLEREKRVDYAKFLTPAELEELELRETRAGKEVQRWLADAKVSEEQRRAVFRLQRDFDDKHSLVFDLSTQALLARETERQALQEQILGLLGPDGFAAWARTEGGNFAQFQQFALQRGLVAEKAIELWRVKNEFIRQNLENEATPGATELELAQRRLALIEATKQQIGRIAGAGALANADPAVFAWLERKK